MMNITSFLICWQCLFIECALLDTNKHGILVAVYDSSSWYLNVVNKYCVLRVGTNGSLPCDYVLTNILDMSAIDTNKHGILVAVYDSSSWYLNVVNKYCVLQVGTKGAGSLPCDYVLTNILDMSAIESMAVLCTSCKAKEKAVARCSDCANFLCPNCNTAHQVS
jgi:hypothetical protein